MLRLIGTGGASDELDHGDDEQGERHGFRRPHPAAAAREPHQDPGRGQREHREPGEPFRQVVARVVADLVGEDDALLGGREAAVEQRVPEDDLARRAEPGGVGVRIARVAAHLLDRERDLGDALLPLELTAAAASAGRRAASS